MSLSIAELAEAKRAVEALLEEIGLTAYIFGVEPRGAQWELKVECATNGSWQTILLPLDPDELRKSSSDQDSRERLLAMLRHKLTACKLDENKDARSAPT